MIKMRFLKLITCNILMGILTIIPIVNSNEFPGVIELIDFNNYRHNNNGNFRQARMKFPQQQQQKQSDQLVTSRIQLPQTSLRKQLADIETVKQNIEEYNKLLKIDTKKLSEQQKDMLERIVERVARLKETLEIETEKNSQNISMSTTLKVPIQTTVKAETIYPDGEINNLTTDKDENISSHSSSVAAAAVETAATSSISDTFDDNTSSVKFITDDYVTTTILPQTTDNLYVTTNLPTTMAGGRSALTTTMQQSDEARANKLSSISGTGGVGGSRTTIISNKSKNRMSSTKKPLTTKPTTTKWITNQYSRPSSSSSSSIYPTISTYSSSIPTESVTIITTTSSKLNEGTQNDFTTYTTNQPSTIQQNKFTNYKPTEMVTDAISDDITTDHFASDDLSEQKTISTIDLHSINHNSNVQPAVQIQERTPIGSANNGGGGGSSGSGSSSSIGNILSSDLIYDSNVTSTSIIDSLSNHAREDYYNKQPLVDSNKEKKPAATGTGKPTKYHYYPHNQHIYLLPECAIQQVCNAVYVRLNYTQPLCACPSRYRDPCSASLNEDDQHTTKLIGDSKKKAITLAKTCEATTEMRECRSPKDWSLLALQNTRTGKSHYLVICRCPDHFKLEGPMAHDQPTYASVPGIRVFGMMCVKPGYSVRKPSVQPPKRYQLQKPYYISNLNKYNMNKDNRPLASSLNTYQAQQQQQQQQQNLQDSYQLQHQANYQYLNRPDSSPVIASHTEYPNLNSFNGAGGGYGRNNERKGETPIEANDEDEQNKNNDNDDNSNNNSNNNNNENIRKQQREKRSINANYNNNNNNKILDSKNANTPEFPWDKLVEFQQSVIWDD